MIIPSFDIVEQCDSNDSRIIHDEELNFLDKSGKKREKKKEKKKTKNGKIIGVNYRYITRKNTRKTSITIY